MNEERIGEYRYLHAAAATGTSATYAGAVSSDGLLTVGDGTHTGTVILAGDNNYSGGTVVQSGTLLVDNAAALGTGNVTVNSGILATEVRPINVLGNYAQNAGGTLQLRVAGANVGQYDSLNVQGNAILGGTLQLISAAVALPRRYRISIIWRSRRLKVWEGFRIIALCCKSSSMLQK